METREGKMREINFFISNPPPVYFFEQRISNVISSLQVEQASFAVDILMEITEENEGHIRLARAAHITALLRLLQTRGVDLECSFRLELAN